MTLGDMVSLLRHKQRVEVRDEYGNELFTSESDSYFLKRYEDCEITEWFCGHAPFKNADFTVRISERKEE